MPLFERERERIERSIDDLTEQAFDEGWNSVLDVLNNVIAEKQMQNDMIAVEVLVYARDRIAGNV